MNIKRITRLLKLLQILHSRCSYNIDALANACDVSRRTAFRDIEALRAAGMQVEFDADGDRYSLPSDYYLPPVNVTPAEALALLVMATELERSDRLPFYDAARSAAVKIESSLRPALRDTLRSVRSAICIQPAPVSKIDSKHSFFQALVDARAARQVLRIVYETAPGMDSMVTKLCPYQLIFRRHSWYVIGKSSLHRAIKAFNLSRIIHLDSLEERYSLPRNFNIESFLGNAWQLSKEPGADYDIEIKFLPLVAGNVAEIKWHKTQRLEFEKDGSLRFRASVSGLNEIVWWILAYGDQAEVIQPDRLRRLVAQRARNMVALYDDSSRHLAIVAEKQRSGTLDRP